MNRLSMAAMELLLELAERPLAQTSHTMLMRGSERTGRELVDWGWLTATENLDSVICEACHDDHAAEVEFDPDNGFRHYCPEGGWVSISADSLRRYRVDLEKLVCWVAAELGVARAQKPVEVQAGLLWDLGDVRLEKRARGASLFVAAGRVNSNNVPKLLEHRRRAAPAALLVTEKAPTRESLPERRWLTMVPLWDCRRVGTGEFRLDREILLDRVHGQRARSADERVTHTAEFYTVTVDGRVFKFTGGKQRHVIKQLYEAWDERKPKVGVQRLLEEADSRARKLSELFKGHPDWKDLVAEERGLAWLRLDEVGHGVSQAG